MPVKKPNNKEPVKANRKTKPKDPNALPKKTGAPFVYNAVDIAKLLNEYISRTDDPMIEEFCMIDGSPCKDTLYRLEKDCKVLSDAIKKLHAKQQIRTVRKAEAGEMNPTFAIFKLKQKCYGWTDKVEIDQNVKGEIAINITGEVKEWGK